MDLKEILMKLGNKLILQHGYDPAISSDRKNTAIIKEFTDWLNNHPEAQNILKEFGLNWRMS